MFQMTSLFGPQFHGLLKPWMDHPNPVALGSFGTALLGILHQVVQQPIEPLAHSERSLSRPLHKIL